MYTQCPECDVAFRVTAEVLRQAAGKVRCGSCGIAFNALEHLSEEKPQAPAHQEPERQVPELTPETPPELEADTPPQSISAEQSAALLKTLDQLAGSDIRIEDTGIEWRVLDVDQETEPKPEEEPKTDPKAETGSLKFFIEDEFDEPELVEEMRFDDNTPLPDDFDSGDVLASAYEPTPVVVEDAPVEDDLEDAKVDLAFGEPEEWEDLLGDLDETELEEDSEQAPETEEGREEEVPQEADDPVDPPLDMDTQFAIQAEAMGIDLSGLHSSLDEEQIDPVEEEPAVDEDKPETSIDEDLIAAAFETEAAAREADEDLDELEGELEVEVDEEPEDELEDELEVELDEEPEDELEDELEVEVDEEPEDDFEDEADEILEAALEEQGHEIEEDEDSDAAASDEHVIPDMTEEELTINMMIDQDLLSVAIEDEDGFASTIVQKQPDKKVERELGGNKERKKEAPLFETIVMEGEFVRGDLDRENAPADKGLALQSALAAIDSDEKEYRETKWPSVGMISGAVVLLLLLSFQYMHQSREALATIPAFNSTVGPAYRALGKPLTPAWNIGGWRFEQTKNSVSDADQLLTIYTRIGNKSDEALPYPLVHVSMTDRFEDIIGSRILEPGEYLATNADPRKLVAPGNTFDAVISIESPSDEATGFKLNVCYRLASRDLRCAIEDFK